MAKEDQDLELDVEGEGSGGKSKKIIIIGAAAALLVGAGIAGFLIFSGGSDTPQEDTEEVVEAPKEPALYVAVPETITARLSGKGRGNTVQIQMSMKVRGSDSVEAVKTHMPQLKNDMLMLLSQQVSDVMRTPEGRDAFKKQCLETVQATMNGLTGKPTVEDVLFIRYVMQ